jgi:membrane protease YdiL (CAAX protease family)
MFVPDPPLTRRLPLEAVSTAAAVVWIALVLSTALSRSLSSFDLQTVRLLIVSPVIEETFFRGVLQSSMRRRTDVLGRPWVTIALTGACFGCAHLGTSSALHSLFVIAPAVAIGWLYERSRSIPLCIAAHCACNAIWLSVWSL